ncbi:MAG: sigma 54-dependent Fis family transcriptional regulator [Myxococcota bacterium]
MANEVATRALAREKGSPTPGARARVVEGPDAGQLVELASDRPVVVGTAMGVDLRLSDTTVSRYHLELSPAPGGVALRDLGSLNGTFAGGMRVEVVTAPLPLRLQLGDTTVVVEPGQGQPMRPIVADDAIPGLVAESEAMRGVVDTLRRLASTNVSLLIEGETGTGKEVAAHAVHRLSERRTAPFVVVDCASVASGLIASELFGHERGAFTSAHRQHVGAFERAAGGTLLLDEVGELPVDLQPNLLGVLERKTFRRIGGERDIPVDVRVLSATNRDLRAEANAGNFRPDLYFRLAVTRVVLPPLRDRREDLPALIDHFVAELAGIVPDEPIFSPQELLSLGQQHWSGNIRELRNLVEGKLALGELATFPTSSTTAAPMSTTIERYRDARARAVSEFERSYLSHLMQVCDNNASEAARRAKMDRPYLLTLLKRHDLR